MRKSRNHIVVAMLVIVILGTSYIWSKPVAAQKAEHVKSGAVEQGLLQYNRPDYSWREIRAYVMQRYREREKAMEAMDAACRETLLEIMEEYDQVLPVEDMQEIMREALDEGLISRDMLICWENVLRDYCAEEVVGEVETFYEKFLDR